MKLFYGCLDILVLFIDNFQFVNNLSQKLKDPMVMSCKPVLAAIGDFVEVESVSFSVNGNFIDHYF